MKISEILIKMACLVSSILIKILQGMLEGIAALSIVGYFVPRIFKIWVDESFFLLLDKISLTSSWSFLFSALLYAFLFFKYEPKKEKSNEKK